MTRDEIIKRMGWLPSAEKAMPDIIDRIEAIVLTAEAEAYKKGYVDGSLNAIQTRTGA